MPAKRIPASSSSGTPSVDRPPPWVIGLTDALAAAQRQFDPANARAVVAVMDHYPAVMEAMAKFATAIGSRSVDAVDLPPSAQEMFLQLGAQQMKAVGPARDGLTAAKRTVLDRIKRYQDARSQDAAWDVRANQS